MSKPEREGVCPTCGHDSAIEPSEEVGEDWQEVIAAAYRIEAEQGKLDGIGAVERIHRITSDYNQLKQERDTLTKGAKAAVRWLLTFTKKARYNKDIAAMLPLIGEEIK